MIVTGEVATISCRSSLCRVNERRSTSTSSAQGERETCVNIDIS